MHPDQLTRGVAVVLVYPSVSKLDHVFCAIVWGIAFAAYLGEAGSGDGLEAHSGNNSNARPATTFSFQPLGGGQGTPHVSSCFFDQPPFFDLAASISCFVTPVIDHLFFGHRSAFRFTGSIDNWSSFAACPGSHPALLHYLSYHSAIARLAKPGEGIRCQLH